MIRLLVFVFALLELVSCDLLLSETDFTSHNGAEINNKSELYIPNKIESDCYTEEDIKKIKSSCKDSLNLLKTSLQSFKFVYKLGERELKIGDEINWEDPDKYGWRVIDMSTHYVFYETPDEWLIQIGSKGERWLKIETLNPKIIELDEDFSNFN